MSSAASQCPLILRAGLPVCSRLAGLQNDNKDRFDFNSKMQKLVMCGLKLEVVQ